MNLAAEKLFTNLALLAFTVPVCLVLAFGALAASRWGRGRRLSVADRTALALALAGLACIAEGRFIEPGWLEVTHVAIATPRLPAGAHLRLVQLSDVHSDGAPGLEPQLPALVAAEHPDAIVFSGDATNKPAGVPVFRALLRSLAAIAPTYAVRGNWDEKSTDFPPTDLFAGTGAIELVGQPFRLPGAAEAWIGGARYRWNTGIAPQLASLPATGLRVFVYHSPDGVELAQGHADLFLAGHTHGGQVRLPFYGALVTMSRFGKRFEAGLYTVGQLHMYVNRGIGMEGVWAPKVRFWCRPELTVLELSGSGSAAAGRAAKR